jgi:tetratricopeptide (TPR) repeat protein
MPDEDRPGDPGEPRPKTLSAHLGDRSVFVQGANQAPITTGDHSPITFTTGDHSPITIASLGPLTPIAGVPGTRPVGLPGRVPVFVGRTAELDALDRALRPAPGLTVRVLHGLGGIGKSALAARYAQLNAARFSQVLWIAADSPEEIRRGLGRFATALEPRSAGFLTAEALEQRASDWLAAHRGWLLVLDDVTTVGDVADLLARLGTGADTGPGAGPAHAVSDAGRILVTTRRAGGWHRIGAQAVRVDVLAPADAVALLAATIGVPDGAEGLEGGDELCAELGYLPLALVQAGAYIAQNHSGGPGRRSTDRYLRLLREHPDKLLSAGDIEDDLDPARTITRVWRVTLDRLAAADAGASSEILRLLAWYAPDAIPLSLFDEVLAEPRYEQAFGRLAAYNMITMLPPDSAVQNGPDGPASPNGPVIAVHRLVQAVARTADADDPHRAAEDIESARLAAGNLLADALPAGEDTAGGWPTWRRLLPHVAAFVDARPPDQDTKEVVAVLALAGPFLRDQGDLAGALSYLRRAREGSLRELGPADRTTLFAARELAITWFTAGNAERAVDMLREVIKISTRELGRYDESTLATLSSLGVLWHVTHSGDGARVLEQVLEDYVRTLGEDHPSTLTCWHNLATVHADEGWAAGAIPCFEAALAGRTRVLGEDHPHTLSSRHGLAACYVTAGHPDQALPLLEQSLEDCRRVIGQDHPATLTVRGDLAQACLEAGQTDRAVALYEECLEIGIRALTIRHPLTVRTAGQLAAAYGVAGDLAKHRAMYALAAVAAEAVFGEDHFTRFYRYVALREGGV